MHPLTRFAHSGAEVSFPRARPAWSGAEGHSQDLAADLGAGASAIARVLGGSGVETTRAKPTHTHTRPPSQQALHRDDLPPGRDDTVQEVRFGVWGWEAGA